MVAKLPLELAHLSTLLKNWGLVVWLASPYLQILPLSVAPCCLTLSVLLSAELALPLLFHPFYSRHREKLVNVCYLRTRAAGTTNGSRLHL